MKFIPQAFVLVSLLASASYSAGMEGAIIPHDQTDQSRYEQHGYTTERLLLRAELLGQWRALDGLREEARHSSIRDQEGLTELQQRADALLSRGISIRAEILSRFGDDQDLEIKGGLELMKRACFVSEQVIELRDKIEVRLRQAQEPETMDRSDADEGSNAEEDVQTERALIPPLKKDRLAVGARSGKPVSKQAILDAALEEYRLRFGGPS